MFVGYNAMHSVEINPYFRMIMSPSSSRPRNMKSKNQYKVKGKDIPVTGHGGP
jgi:hypothetical protein